MASFQAVNLVNNWCLKYPDLLPAVFNGLEDPVSMVSSVVSMYWVLKVPAYAVSTTNETTGLPNQYLQQIQQLQNSSVSGMHIPDSPHDILDHGSTADM